MRTGVELVDAVADRINAHPVLRVEKARFLAEGACDVPFDAGKRGEMVDPALELRDIEVRGVGFDEGERHLVRVRGEVVDDDVVVVTLEGLCDAGGAGEEVTNAADVREPLHEGDDVRDERPL